MKQQNITVNFDAKVAKFIAEKSYDPSYGARMIRRNVQELIEDPIAEKIISGEIAEMNEVKISAENEKMTIKQTALAKV
jgi:ATP-dependent Clp protease ATP-binding subunit ClpB